MKWMNTDGRSPWWGPLAVICTVIAAAVVVLVRITGKRYILVDMSEWEDL